MSFLVEGLGSEILSALSERAGIALPYITHGVHAGLSSNQIQAALSSAGMGLRRSVVQGLVRSVRNTTLGAAYQRGLKYNELPNPSFFKGSKGFMRHRYAYVVKVNGVNQITGQRETQHVTISTPNVLSNESIGNYLEDMMLGETGSTMLVVNDYNIEEVLVDPRYIP